MKIYIVPTRFGLVISASLLVMVATGIIYGNNSIFLIAFTAASLLLALLLETHRTLKSIDFMRAEVANGFAGSVTELRVLLRNKSRVKASAIEITPNSDKNERFTLSAMDQRLCVAHMEIRERGRHKLKRIRVGTTAPVGLFWAWAYVKVDLNYIGYPNPRGDLPAPAATHLSEGSDPMNGREGEDFSGHQAFEPGHSWRRVDWKAVSRGRPWLIKNFQGGEPKGVSLDISKLSGDIESKLSQLCLWVKQAHGNNIPFSLRLGSRHHPTGAGPVHATKCLEELGLYDSNSSAA